MRDFIFTFANPDARAVRPYNNQQLMTYTRIEPEAGRIRYFWLVAVCVIAFFVNAGVLQSDLMESRNLVTAQEMTRYGNWLTPTMNGTLRLEKPPLPTWVAGAIELLRPDSLPAQRAAAGVMGALWTLFLYLTVRAATRRDHAAVVSCLIFLTCYSVVLMGRTATWDIYCHAWMQGAVWLIFSLYYPRHAIGKGRRIWEFTACGVMMGLSFLSKGPVAFFALLLPFLIACPFYGRPRRSPGNGWGLTAMIAAMVAVSVWWYVYIYLVHPEMASAVLHKETGAWVNHNVRAWWYYWRYSAETGVWALITTGALVAPVLSRKVRRDRALVFAVVWMAASVILLSLMPEKKMRYLLPAMAPCAMSAGLLLCWIESHRKECRWGRVLFRVNAWLIAAATAVLAGGALYMWLGMGKADAWVAVTGCALLLGVAAWMGICAVKMRVTGFVDAVAVLFIVAECLLMSQVTHFFVNPEFHSLKEVRGDVRLEGMELYSTDKGVIRMELVMAAGRRILPADFSDARAMLRLMPCAVVTHGPVREALPAELLQQTDTLRIGVYDDNRHPRTDRHYNQGLISYVTILRVKSQE